MKNDSNAKPIWYILTIKSDRHWIRVVVDWQSLRPFKHNTMGGPDARAARWSCCESSSPQEAVRQIFPDEQARHAAPTRWSLWDSQLWETSRRALRSLRSDFRGFASVWALPKPHSQDSFQPMATQRRIQSKDLSLAHQLISTGQPL